MPLRLLLCTLLLVTATAFSQVTFTSNTLRASGPTVTGDFNRDGHPDLAVLNTSGDGHLYVYFGVGDGNFNLAFINDNVPTSMTEMHTADFNNDGILDLVLTSSQGTAGYILYGTADGNFTSGPVINFAKDVQQVQLGDVNNDGKVDIVATECTPFYTLPCQIETKLNKGNGVFADSQTLALSQVPQQTAVADINRDGKLDLITAFAQPPGSTGRVQIYRGNGDGTFSPLSSITVPVVCTNTIMCSDYVSGFVMADFYNDTNLHLVLFQSHLTPSGDGAGTGSLYTYKNNGSGTYTLAHATSVSQAETSILAADLNVDEKQDLMVNDGAIRATNAYYLLGNGNGTFQVPITAPWDVSDGGLALTRDLELTSRPDVISTSGPYGEPYTMINLNTTDSSNCPPPGSDKLAAKICTPVSGGTSPATVTVRASGNSPAGVQRLEIWIDGVKRGERWADQIAESFTLSAGSHRVTVVAVDQYLGYAKSTVSITTQ